MKNKTILSQQRYQRISLQERQVRRLITCSSDWIQHWKWIRSQETVNLQIWFCLLWCYKQVLYTGHYFNNYLSLFFGGMNSNGGTECFQGMSWFVDILFQWYLLIGTEELYVITLAYLRWHLGISWHGMWDSWDACGLLESHSHSQLIVHGADWRSVEN